MAMVVAAAVVLWVTTSASVADELMTYLLWGETTRCALQGEGIITGEPWMIFA